MKLYARARRPDGEVVRVTLGTEAGTRTQPAPTPERPEAPAGVGEPLIPSWWDRWWLLRAIQQTGYQRLF
jgi:hypothetical protein